MKLNEFIRFQEEKCPRCQGALILQKTSWSDMSGDLHYVFCEPCHCKGNGANDKETALANFYKELARKQRLDCQKPKAILTDILNYLNGLLAEWNGAGIHLERICLVEKQLASLAEYAEKLGVEL